MSRADITSILPVVVEILLIQDAILIADQAVRSDRVWIEFDLNLDVLCNRYERPTSLADQDLLRLEHGIEICVVAVSLIGQLLHRGVFQVPRAYTKDGQKDAACALFLDETHELILVRDADVEITVGCQNDAIHAATGELISSDLIG